MIIISLSVVIVTRWVNGMIGIATTNIIIITLNVAPALVKDFDFSFKY